MSHTSVRALRIAIATTGRFHVLDLARELDALGHEVRLYTVLPGARAARFGLPSRCHVFLAEALPWALLARFGPPWLRGWANRRTALAANRAVIRRLQACDVFIGMSGTILEAAREARRRFNARIVVERGSRHVLSQAEILKALPGAETPSSFTIERELSSYEEADRIAIPSSHVRDSFLERGVPNEKLMINPYGVDLRRFAPVETRRNPKQVLFVGRWGLRKGADRLEQAVRDMQGVTLLHAGMVDDYPFPDDPRFKSLGHVDQLSLPEIYSAAGVLALPSREEGLALVLIQALACGLPVVCSDRSGGEDLRAVIERREAVTIAPVEDHDRLREAIASALDRTDLRGGDLLGDNGRETLSWPAYGRRYSEALQRLVAEREDSARAG